jgi:O-antigen ligase
MHDGRVKEGSILRADKLQPERLLPASLPLILFIRSLFDGRLNFNFGNISATQVIGFALFIITIFIFMTRYRHGSIFLFIISGILTLSCSEAIQKWGLLSRDELIRNIGIFGIYLTAAYSTKDYSATRFFQALKVTSTSCSLYAVYQIATHTGGNFVSGGWRYSGFMYHSNTAALLYGSYLLAELTILKNIKSRFRRFTFCLNLIGLAITVSIGGLLFFGFGILLLAFLSSNNKKFKTLTVSFITLTTFLFLNFLLFPAFRAKINLSVLPVFSQNANDGSSLQWRFDAWRTFLNYWINSPIIGQGFGSTRNLNMVGSFMPHDEYVRLLVEVGVLGLVMFMSLYLLILYKILDIYKLFREPISLYTTTLMLLMLVNAISENTFTYTVPEYILAASIGFTFSKQRRVDSRFIPLSPSQRRALKTSNSEISEEVK